MQINDSNIFLDKENYEKKEWVKLINSLGGFKSANLIGSESKKGVKNLSMISSVFHVGASPALMGYVSRPNSVDSARDTLNNILETKEFTINHVNKSFYKQAHQASARYPTDVSEFEACDIEHEYKGGPIKAPYVKKSNIKIGLSLVETIDIKINNTVLIIGEVKEIYLNKELIMPDGYIDIEAAGSLSISSLDSYHEVSRISRLSYAKKNKVLAELNVKGGRDGVD